MKILALLALGLLMAGCAHHRDVRAGADGVHTVKVQGEDTEQGARDAISQANHFCKQRNQAAAFLDEKQAYKGQVDEETYKKGKVASKVATTAGGALWVFGNKGASNVGGLVGLGGAAANAALGEGYAVEMRFKCM